jgi:hypothetical protein
VTVRVGGFGSELPLELITVIETVNMPGFAKATFWLGTVRRCRRTAREHPGVRAGLLVVLKLTASPALIVTLPVGVVIALSGEEHVVAGRRDIAKIDARLSPVNE